MIPELWNELGTEKIGDLNDCLECFVEEERNGIFELTLEYPNGYPLADQLLKEKIIVVNANDTLLNQKFRIYDTKKFINETITVFARHISFDLMYDYVGDVTFEHQSCEYALNSLFRQSQFSTHYRGYSDIVNAQNYSMSMCNILEAIGGKEGSVIDTFGTGAEILRDNTDIHVLNARGHDNGVTIEYAKNLTGFELSEDTTSLVTRILPYAKYAPEGGKETLVRGSFIDSPLINNYSHPYIKHIDYSDKFKDKEIPTKEKLETFARNEYRDNKVDIPKTNFKIEFIPLSKCVGYEELEDKISICDKVAIKNIRYNVDTKAKVIKYKFDVLKDRYESMELGEPRATLGDIIGSGSGESQVGPQGPPGADGSIEDFPNSLPQVPVLTAKVYGFATVELSWTFEDKVYYTYEVYASKTKDFTPNDFDLIHAGQTSSFLFQAKPNETWYFRVCAKNTHGERTDFSPQIVANTKKIDDLSNYVDNMAIGEALIGELSLDRGWVGKLNANYLDVKGNFSVTDGNGKRTFDIDSFGNIYGDFAELKLNSVDIRKRNSGVVNLIHNSSPTDMRGWKGLNSVITLSENLNANIKYPVKVHFVWLSREGDCILIECENGKKILIDGGEADTADSTISYLYNIGVKNIDLIIATHSHSDHIGSTPKIIDNFGCKELLIREPDWSKMPNYEIAWDTKGYHDRLIAKATEVGAVIRRPSEGEVLNVSKEISLKIFNTLTEDYTAYNYLSFSILMTHLQNKFFFGGDMSIQSEWSVLGKIGKVDTLCVPHSGYDDSTSGALLSELNPNYSVILNPHVNAWSNQFDRIRTEETRNRLQFYNSIVYATEQNGTIVLNSNADGYSLSANNQLLYTNKWWYNNNSWYWFKADGRIAKNESIWIFDNTHQKNKLFHFNEYGVCTNP